VFYCERFLWLKLEARMLRPGFQPGASHMRTKSFTVIQNGKPIFIVHAYSLDQARALVATKVAGEAIVVAQTKLSSWDLCFDGAAR
jgi:hypothetical protein